MLKLSNINFSYNSNGSGFTVDVKESIFYKDAISCILGQNGSGKTTLLKIIGGHLASFSGNIFIDDIDIANFNAQERPTSTLFQSIGLFPHLSVIDNIKIALEPNKLFKYSMQTNVKANDYIVMYELEDLKNKFPNQLSIGQQQRIGIARAICTKPKILLLDEPTSALDFKNINYLKKTLLKLKKAADSPIVIIVSHDLPFVMNVADDIKYIENGTIIFDGKKSDFKNSKYYIN